jgi:hypothetical protein
LERSFVEDDLGSRFILVCLGKWKAERDPLEPLGFGIVG